MSRKKANKSKRGPLKFVSGGNAKLPKDTTIFSLPAGHSCPCAHECLTKADRDTGRLTDGRFNKFRCYAASQEAVFRTARESRWHNFKLLVGARSKNRMEELILQSLSNAEVCVRVHASGDFFNQTYFNAWVAVAQQRPDTIFYAYTKSLGFWVKWITDPDKSLPENFRLTASRGGKEDHLIERYDLRESVVVFHPEEAEALGLEIDHDDSHAREAGNKSFALSLHGSQPPGTEASDAIKRMKEEGVKFSYSKK